jgi:hypothetical protein
VLASAIAAGAGTTFKSDFDIPLLRLAAGLLQILLSFGFWKLDLRNRQLVKAAEAALMSFELNCVADDWSDELPLTLLFAREHRDTERRKEGLRKWPQRWPFSYTEVFELLFATFGLVGLTLVVTVWIPAVATWGTGPLMITTQGRRPRG